MDLDRVLAQFFAVHSWSQSTEEDYRRILTKFLTENEQPCAMEALDFRDWLEGHETWGENMRWLAYIAVRNFLRWQCGQQCAALQYRFRRRERGKPQRTLSYTQVIRLIESIDPTTVKGKRDLALVLFMLDTGVRASEVCRLAKEHLDLQHGRFAVLAKGGRWRKGVFGERTAKALKEWLAVHPDPNGRTVFASVGGTKPGKPLTPSGLRVIFRKLGEQADIGRISPHDFRRTFATLAILAGAPTRLVQLAGGWKQLEMVERYSRALLVDDFRSYLPSSQIPEKTG